MTEYTRVHDDWRKWREGWAEVEVKVFRWSRSVFIWTCSDEQRRSSLHFYVDNDPQLHWFLFLPFIMLILNSYLRHRRSNVQKHKILLFYLFVLNISLNKLFELDNWRIPPVTLSNSLTFSLYFSRIRSTFVFFFRLAAGDTYPVGVNTGLCVLEDLGRLEAVAEENVWIKEAVLGRVLKEDCCGGSDTSLWSCWILFSAGDEVDNSEKIVFSDLDSILCFFFFLLLRFLWYFLISSSSNLSSNSSETRTALLDLCLWQSFSSWNRRKFGLEMRWILNIKRRSKIFDIKIDRFGYLNPTKSGLNWWSWVSFTKVSNLWYF